MKVNRIVWRSSLAEAYLEVDGGLAPRFYPTLIEGEHRLFPSWNNRPWLTKLGNATYCLWETEVRASE